MNYIGHFKITVLVEDTCPKRPYKGEHGLSLFIEADEKRILFDSGLSGKVLLENAKALNIDFNNLDAFILSHPHDDHSGGMLDILNYLENIPVYCIENAFDEDVPNGKEIKNKLKNAIYIKEGKEIFPGIHIPQQRPTLNTPKATKEINLVVNLKNKGLVIVIGCAHHSLPIIVKNADDIYQNQIPIHALIGGLHLKDTKDKEIIDQIQKLKNYGLKYLVPNHCTGFNALRVISQEMPEEFSLLKESPSGTFYTGMSLEL